MRSSALVKPSEANFQLSVIHLARIGGWELVHAERTSLQRSGKWCTAVQGDTGYPDLTMVHPAFKRVIWIELKVKSDLSAEQYEWLYSLQTAGCEAYVIKPEDWDELLHILGIQLLK